MLNTYAEFQLPSTCQTLVIEPDNLYCGKCEKFQNHAVTLTLVLIVPNVRLPELFSYTIMFEFHESMHSRVIMFTDRHTDNKNYNISYQPIWL